MPGMKQRVKERLMLFQLRHSRFFDEKWYREQAGLPAGTDAAAHYYRGGWRAHDPSPAFRQEAYLEARTVTTRTGFPGRCCARPAERCTAGSGRGTGTSACW